MSAAAPCFYNTLTRTRERFEPLEPPEVRIYACGPTVYDDPHLGNFRSFVWVDILHRYLRWRGFDVRLIVNITDIDDRTIERARAAGVELAELTERYTSSFLSGLEALTVLPAAEYPRATAHVADMIRLVGRLLEGGHAYRADDSVFFRVASFPSYGSLAHLDPDEMRATERVEDDDFGKEDPRDFALWKGAKEGEPSWEAPFGQGRPGWHLECSAMSMKYLGETFDLHLGGQDLVFPHHENEIAQSEAATGKPFVRTWMHCSHLIVDGVKMSKSLGNFYTLKQLLERGHSARAIRYLLASVHYRRQLNFTFDALEQAQAAIDRVSELVARIERVMPEMSGTDTAGDSRLAEALETARAGFGAALDDDLNTAGALGCLFTLVRESNAALDARILDAPTAAAIVDWIRETDEVFVFLPGRARLRELRFTYAGREILASGVPLEPRLEELVLARTRARLDRDFATADRLREQLAQEGVEIEDTAEGVRWRR